MLALYSHYMPYLKNLCQKLVRKDEEGQTMVEYVMLIVLVAVAVFIASPSVTNAILNVFTGTSSLLGSGFSS